MRHAPNSTPQVGDSAINQIRTNGGAHLLGYVYCEIALRQIVTQLCKILPGVTVDTVKSALQEAAGYARYAAHSFDRFPQGGIAVFGSARTVARGEPGSTDFLAEVHQKAHDAGAYIASNGIYVISGAGPGVMAASCLGANPKRREDGLVIGHAIHLPHESPNLNVPPKNFAMYQTFPFRKLALMGDTTNGVLVFPGGAGTLEEFFEVISLVHEGNLANKPVCFVGNAFWKPMIDKLCALGLITSSNEKPGTSYSFRLAPGLSGVGRVFFVDNPSEGIDLIIQHTNNKPASRFQNLRITHNLDRDFLSPYADTLNTLGGHGQSCIDADGLDEIFNFLHDTLLCHPTRGVTHRANFTQDVAYGFLKHAVDRLVAESVFKTLGVDKFVLQLGTIGTEQFDHTRRLLLQQGHTVVSRLSPQGIIIWRDGLDPFALPLNYRTTAIDLAAGACSLETGLFDPTLNRLSAIVATDGGLRTLHRWFQLHCWIQTGKLARGTPLIGVYPENNQHSIFHPEQGFVRPSVEALCNSGFVKPSDFDLFSLTQSPEQAVALINEKLAR